MKLSVCSTFDVLRFCFLFLHWFAVSLDRVSTTTYMIKLCQNSFGFDSDYKIEFQTIRRRANVICIFFLRIWPLVFSWIITQNWDYFSHVVKFFLILRSFLLHSIFQFFLPFWPTEPYVKIRNYLLLEKAGWLALL